MQLRPWIGAGLLALIACGNSTTSVGPEASAGSGAGGVVPPAPLLVPADGVTITKISIYQGVERPLVIDGAAQTSDVPIVAGRDALIRVFYQAQDVAGGAATARLELGDEDPIDVELDLSAGSNDGDLQTTANFFLEGSRIQEALRYRVSILEDAALSSGGPTDGAVYPAEGREEHAVEPAQTFRIVMVPFRYDADGSGRLPDTSPEAMERYRQRFLSLYPVSDVEMTLRDPVPWTTPIAPNGQGWQEVGQQLFGIRQNETPSPDVYYYAFFNPTDSLAQFCGQGCLLGVTLLNNQPEDVGEPALRLGLGVGFDSVVADTAAHEIGHSHGREHVDCGPGLDPNSIDDTYPYPGNTIGVWGYDIVSQEMKDPATHTDIMGYCDNQWISDHNFINFFNRGRNVNLPRIEGDARQPYAVVSIDGDGEATWMQDVEMRPLMGRGTDVTVTTAEGAVERGAHFYAWDHLPGGWLLIPGGADISALDGVVDGVELHLTR